MTLVRARETFFYGVRKVTAGDLVDSSATIVKRCPGMFAEPTVTGVEEATAVPGTKRARKPVKKAKTAVPGTTDATDG